MMRMFRKSDEGFTLVELMVVVLIIGILVAIAIPVFNAASRSARQRTCHSNQRIIEGAVQQFLASDPGNTVAMVDGQVRDAVQPSATSPGDLIPEYIKDQPLCPFNDAIYSVDASGSTTCPDTTEDHGRYSD